MDSTPRSPVELHRLATAIRLRATRMVAGNGFGYLGQALSAAEQFAALYDALRPGRDRLVVSPGHYVIVAYAAAAEVGLLAEAALDSYGRNDSALPAIGGEETPGVDYTCGSLGQGLSAAAGFALADRMHARTDPRTFAVLSDGELQEGQLWEAALFAGHQRLGRLVAVVDANNSQVDGPVDSITTVEPIAEKFRSFGWDATAVDGHDAPAVREALDRVGSEPRPRAVICHTSVRHGLRCLPETADGHFVTLPADLARDAIAELTAELVACDD